MKYITWTTESGTQIFAEVVGEHGDFVNARELCAVGVGGWSDAMQGEGHRKLRAEVQPVHPEEDGNAEYAGFERLASGKVVYASTDPELPCGDEPPCMACGGPNGNSCRCYV